MNYTIVVAEDELLLLNSLIKKIKNTNLMFEVVAFAQTGIQAYDLIEKHKPNILITDIKMPTMDGLTLIKQVRDYYPDIDCVIISGFSDFEFTKKAIHYQVADYILKPIDDDALYKTLLSLQNKYLQQEKNYSKLFIQQTSKISPEEIAIILQTHLVNHFNEDIKLNEISKEINYSTSYLSKIFHQYFKCSPSHYLISLRIQKAQQLLKYSTELSVRQVGEAVGYPEQGYFSRIFKKNIGVSPLDYREQFINSNL